MTTAEFLVHLKDLGVEVAADGDRLRCGAPAGALTPDLRREIAQRKPEILAALASGPATAPRTPSGAIPRVARARCRDGRRALPMRRFSPPAPMRPVSTR